MYVSIPIIIIPLVIGALFEMWLVFVFSYAALDKRAKRPYWRRVRDVLRFRLR